MFARPWALFPRTLFTSRHCSHDSIFHLVNRASYLIEHRRYCRNKCFVFSLSVSLSLPSIYTETCLRFVFSVVFVSKETARRSEMARRDRWEFCFTESFTTFQGQNGQKRIARAMTKVEGDGEMPKNLVENNSKSPRRVLSRFFFFGGSQKRKSPLCLSIEARPTTCPSTEKRKRLIYI